VICVGCGSMIGLRAFKLKSSKTKKNKTEEYCRAILYIRIADVVFI